MTAAGTSSELVSRERANYDLMWGVPAYRDSSPGAQYVPFFVEMGGPRPTDQILDAGCGAGQGALALVRAGFPDVVMCDLSTAGIDDPEQPWPADVARPRFHQVCLWHDLRGQLGYLAGEKVDWVYCCDVLEHIPPQFTMLVIARLLEVARKGVFLSINLMPDELGAWIGTPLHQSVQTFVAWRDQIATLGRIRECRDLLGFALFLVEPL